MYRLSFGNCVHGQYLYRGTSSTWHNITIDQAREARRARDEIDMRNIKQIALRPGSLPSTSGLDKDKARALMLAISPSRDNQSSNFQSNSGVVHINSQRDWANFEAEGDDDGNSTDKSIEEILGGRVARGTGRRKPGNTQES